MHLFSLFHHKGRGYLGASMQVLDVSGRVTTQALNSSVKAFVIYRAITLLAIYDLFV